MAEHAEATISLREITKENLRDVLRLKVAPEQERFVASNAVSIAQAYFDRDVADSWSITDIRNLAMVRAR